MKNNKAPGKSGVATEVMKALLWESKKILVDSIIQSFWNERTENYKEWNTAILKLLHKKGSKKALTNYRRHNCKSHKLHHHPKTQQTCKERKWTTILTICLCQNS
jgi:hypothetical protein